MRWTLVMGLPPAADCWAQSPRRADLDSFQDRSTCSSVWEVGGDSDRIGLVEPSVSVAPLVGPQHLVPWAGTGQPDPVSEALLAVADCIRTTTSASVRKTGGHV